MQKRPIHDLTDEHGGIFLMTRILSKLAEGLKRGEEIDKKDLNKILDIFLNFIDKCHHGKEEKFLFPVMAKKGLNKELIKELLGEHKLGRKFVGEFKSFLKQYPSAISGLPKMASKIEEYNNLLIEHIRKENTKLFPQAEKELPQKVQDKMQIDFEKFESEVIGIGKHEEYHDWLNDLKQLFIG